MAEGERTIYSAREGPSEKAPPALPRGTGKTGRGRIGTALTGSPLLPRTPGGPSTTRVSPCTPKAEREVGVRRGARAPACLLIAPCPKDLPCLLWVLGPQGLPVRKVRCCKDAQQGAGSTSLGTPIPGGASFSPQLLIPQSPLPCPHALRGSQARPVGEKRGMARKGPGSGCS